MDDDVYDDSGSSEQKSGPLTSVEKSVLLELIREKKDVVESKKTDFGTTGKKQKAWESIASKFISQPGCSRRNWKQLRTWWDNSKKRAKKNVTKQKREMRKTGGGPRTLDLNRETKEVMAIVPNQLKSLDNEFDCDHDMDLYCNNTTPIHSPNKFEDSAGEDNNDDKKETKSLKRKVRDPRSSLVDFEYEEHKLKLKILAVEYETARLKKILVEKQLEFTDAENTLKLKILSSELTTHEIIIDPSNMPNITLMGS